MLFIFASPFSSTQEGNRNKAVRPNFSLNISENLHLTRKDHHCKYIFQFVTAETRKWRLYGHITADRLSACVGRSLLAIKR